MKILVATGIAPPEIGGPVTYLEGMLPELCDRGHQVSVLGYGAPSPVGSRQSYTLVPRNPTVLRFARYATAHARLAARADLTVVLGLCLPRLRFGRVPIALRVPGDIAWEKAINRGWIGPQVELEQFQTNRFGARVEALKALRSREARRADLVIAPSEYVRRLVLSWGVDPQRITVIPNAVRPDVAARSLTRVQARRRLGWDQDRRYLVTAARLTRWKGIDLVIESVAALPEVHLVVAGDGPEGATLAQAAAYRGTDVTFCGALSRSDLALRLRAADYLVVYSAYEGLSHTIVEALALGTPVVASNRGGNPEVVSDGVNGLLVPYPDADALTNALRRAFTADVSQQLRTGAAAASIKADWRRFVEQTIDALEAVAQSSRDTVIPALRQRRHQRERP